MHPVNQSILKDIDIKEVIFQPILEPQGILAHSPARRRRRGVIRVITFFDPLLAGQLVLILLLLLLHSYPSRRPAAYLGLGGRSILGMQQVTQQRADLFACLVISNFEPCSTFVLAKHSTRLVNHCDYFGNDGRFGYLAVSMRISLYEHASDNTEATVSDMVETVLASTANYRVVGWFKVIPKLRSPSSKSRV
jgi:hypothetical protein